MKPTQIGLLGLGTVGRGVLEIIRADAETLRHRAGIQIRVARIFDRSYQKKTELLQGVPASDRAEDVLDDPEIEVVLELIGGLEPAYQYVKRALEQGKSVVTANKALLARHGNELFQIARERNLEIGFEAAVAGGLPIIQNMRRGLIANEIRGIYGILNGTSNFILTRMQEDGMDYGQAVRLAQEKGFAEADPSFDVNGNDAAQKLAILSALAFDTTIDEKAVIVEGISGLREIDLEFAATLGRVVRPLAVAELDDAGRIMLRVHPAMVPRSHPLAAVRDEKNAVFFDASNTGPTLIMGLGAGSHPTAAAVLSDVVFCARAAEESSEIWISGNEPPERSDDYWYRFYLRFETRDQPGVLAELARILAEEEISIATVRQPEGREPINVVVVTHEVNESALKRAIARVDASPSVLAPTTIIRFEDQEF